MRAKKEELRGKILALLLAGKSRRYVEKALNASHTLVHRVAVENGIQLQNKLLLEDADLIEQLFEAGLSRKEVCEKFEVTHCQLKSFCVKHSIDMPDSRKNLSDARKEELRGYVALQKKTLAGKHVSKKARQILELGLKGLDEHQIANRLYCKPDYVNRILAVHGVKKCVKVQDAKAKVERASKYSGNIARNISAIYGMSIGQAYSCIKLSRSEL